MGEEVDLRGSMGHVTRGGTGPKTLDEPVTSHVTCGECGSAVDTDGLETWRCTGCGKTFPARRKQTASSWRPEDWVSAFALGPDEAQRVQQAYERDDAVTAL